MPQNGDTVPKVAKLPLKSKCQFAGKCKGCTLLQIPYADQLQEKTRLVRSTFAHFLDKGQNARTAIAAIVPSPKELAYRTSTKLCLGEDELKGRSIGLYEKSRKNVVNIPDCPAHDPAINKLLKKIFPVGIAPPAPFYLHHRNAFQPGKFKFITVRFSPINRQYGVVISHTGVDRNTLEAWAKNLSIPGLCLYESEITKDDKDLILSHQAKHLFGEKAFRYVIGNNEFALDPLAFFQANFSLLETFIGHITGELSGDTLLDLYGGFGSYSLNLARNFRKICLVETNPHAILAGKNAANSAKITNLDAKVGRVENFLRKIQRTSGAKEISHVIVNPPRTGLSSEVANLLISPDFANLEEIRYVSCDQTTLKRDLMTLCKNGPFRLEKLTPFDMFPQTGHIELVAKLLRR